jgi:MgtC family
VLREVSEGATISAQARELFDGLWEVVRARGLRQLAPELWAVMLVDENGHAKGLPLNRRGGELYGADAIAGDALICQERRTSFLGVIIKGSNDTVRGLMTAASLWGTAAIGILAGAGEPLTAVATAGLVLVVLESPNLPILRRIHHPIPTPMRARLAAQEEERQPEA